MKQYIEKLGEQAPFVEKAGLRPTFPGYFFDLIHTNEAKEDLISNEEFYRILSDATGLTPSFLRNDIIHKTSVANEFMITLARDLALKGYVTAIFTNADYAVTKEFLSSQKLENIFQKIVIPSAIGGALKALPNTSSGPLLY